MHEILIKKPSFTLFRMNNCDLVTKNEHKDGNTMGFTPISLQTELKTLTNVGIHSRLRQMLPM